MMQKYNHKAVEKKWQKHWQDKNIWETTEDKSSPKFYILDMFPYPSAEGLHVGHPEGYTASDIVSRYMRMKGYNVLHPMGFDSFGLPAENYAIKTGTHPSVTTKKNIDNMRQQIERLGFSYDWSREVQTTDPEYYKWTQWIFLQLFKSGLAYEDTVPINWCPSCKTGLANEEVVAGKCERCDAKVSKKNIRQWLLRITRYADRLLKGLDKLDWPEPIKLLQKNWIGRSEGAEVCFSITKKLSSRVVLMHGFNGHPDTGWKAWLKQEIDKTGIQMYAPNLPGNDTPKVSEHLDVLKNIKIDQDTVIIGHSLGCITALYYLQTMAQKIDRLVLVAPPFKSARSKKAPPYPDGVLNYGDWKFDFIKIKRQVNEIIVLADVNDDKVTIDEPRSVAKELKARLIVQAAPRPHFAACGGGPYKVDSIKQAVMSDSESTIKVFTTRPDTLFGATYMVVAPEHPLVARSASLVANWSEVQKYVQQAKSKSDLERTDLAKVKTGVELKGIKAINPVNSKKISIWVADYVLISYGTGAIMAVPGHDERDRVFAKKFKLPIVKVVNGFLRKDAGKPGEDYAFTGEGVAVNSGEFDGLPTAEFKKKITIWLQKKGVGKKAVNYKLRDWVFSRQRYWGEPIPIIHCEKCGAVPVSEKGLPVKLPEVENYKPTGTGESPLATIEQWVNVKCPKCKGEAKRETNTMPQWAGSCWYYLRYLDPKNKKELVGKAKEKYWMQDKGVDLYVGGAEHAVLHLMYARFWHMFLFDQGVVSTEEPFYKLKNQGIILGEDNQKMSKSRGNVINPDDVIKEFGADSMRMYEMFMGPFEDVKPWSTQGIRGVYRFLNKVWVMREKVKEGPVIEEFERLKHKLIKKITEDIETFNFNTAVSSFMEAVNTMNKEVVVPKSLFETVLVLLSPFAPHIAEELWELLGHEKNIAYERWPAFDKSLIKEETVEVIVQVNGKLRDRIKAAADSSQEKVEEIALASEKVKKYIQGEPRKVIFIKNRLINFVI